MIVAAMRPSNTSSLGCKLTHLLRPMLQHLDKDVDQFAYPLTKPLHRGLEVPRARAGDAPERLGSQTCNSFHLIVQNCGRFLNERW